MDIFTNLQNPHLLPALETNMYSFLTNYGRIPQRELYVGKDMLRFWTGLQFPFFNGVCNAQLLPNQIDNKISETLNYFTSRNTPMFWWTGPSTQPPDLGTHLESHGFICTSQCPLMAIDLQNLPSEETSASLNIKFVQDNESFQQWLRVVMVGFDIPDALFDDLFVLESSLNDNQPLRRRYLGLSQGKPVATSELYLDAGVAGIYCVATMPEARKQGFARAVTLYALREAHNLGYRIGTLQASDMGASVYRQIGFEEYGKIGFYLFSN